MEVRMQEPTGPTLIDRLEAYYRRVLKDRLGIESPLLAIPPELRPDSEAEISHACLTALANLAHYEPDLASFHARIEAAVHMHWGGTLQNDSLTAADVMDAIDVLLSEQDAAQSASGPAATVQQDATQPRFRPGRSSRGKKATRALPPPPTSSVQSGPASRSKKRKQPLQQSSGAEEHVPLRKGLRTKAERKSKADVYDHAAFFDLPKDQHFKNREPNFVKDVDSIDNINTLDYPVEVRVFGKRGEYREIEDAAEMRAFQREKRRYEARKAAKGRKQSGGRAQERQRGRSGHDDDITETQHSTTPADETMPDNESSPVVSEHISRESQRESKSRQPEASTARARTGATGEPAQTQASWTAINVDPTNVVDLGSTTEAEPEDDNDDDWTDH